jgi:hypothetical protein
VVTQTHYNNGVAAEAREHAAALAVRAWIERGSPPLDGLRARITSTIDLTTPEQTVTVVANPEEILGEVRSWLERFLEASRD